jgi:hypothetical protein
MRFFILTLCILSFSCRKTVETKTEVITTSTPSYASGISTDLTRLSPEQVSNALRQSLGLELTWTAGDGRKVDGIVTEYGIPLGGIDFANTFERDPTSQIHTLLTVRLLSWQGAEWIVWKDGELLSKGGSPKLFDSGFLMWQYIPGSQYEDKWTAQLEKIYWSLLSRAPDAEELALQKAAFTDIASNDNPGVAWIASIYAILASSEYWNLWGKAL